MALRVCLVGVGNSALALIRSLELSRLGLLNFKDSCSMPAKIAAGLNLSDIEIVASYDIDTRKVGKELRLAVESLPNKVFWKSELVLQEGRYASVVQMGRILDGAPSHLRANSICAYLPSDKPQISLEELSSRLRHENVDVLVLFLPTGSVEAASFYLEAAILANCGVVSCNPTPLAQSISIATRFRERGLPIVGDDIKSQIGTTAIHEAMFKLLRERGLVDIKTYQMSIGGNADHLNLSNPSRQVEKAKSKEAPLRCLSHEGDQIGPTTNCHLEWTHDRKRSYVYFEATSTLGHSVRIDVSLEVSDSPNSAAVVLDVIRIAAAAREKSLGGALLAGSERFMKSVPTHNVGFSLNAVLSDEQ